jgi:hypothetical protein
LANLFSERASWREVPYAKSNIHWTFGKDSSRSFGTEKLEPKNMIKFFRQIRQQLVMETGKTTKPALPPASPSGRAGRYFKYAIGEIILVVIGILIALQINSWNIERLNKIEEQRYLKAIKTDLKKDALRLEDLVNRIAKELTTLKQIKKELASDSTPINQNIEFTNSFLTTFSFNPEKATLEDLKSSGKLNLLENKKLKDSLLSYYNYVDNKIFAINTSIISYTRAVIAPFLMTDYTLEYDYPKSLITEKSKIVSLNSEQKENQFLNNAVKYRIYILSVLKESYEDLVFQINRHQEALYKEIKT